MQPDLATSFVAEPSPMIRENETVFGVAADMVFEKQNLCTCILYQHHRPLHTEMLQVLN